MINRGVPSPLGGNQSCPPRLSGAVGSWEAFQLVGGCLSGGAFSTQEAVLKPSSTERFPAGSGLVNNGTAVVQPETDSK